MAQVVESRGWEIESNYNEHVLDDPIIDIAEDERQGLSPVPALFFLLVLAITIGTYLAGKWLEPPKLVLPAPLAPRILTPPPDFKGTMWECRIIAGAIANCVEYSTGRVFDPSARSAK